jgi:hypothetical protein
MKIKQASLTLIYNILQKRMAELEDFVKRGLPNFDDLRVVTDRINEISNQTTGLTEAVAGAKFSNTMPDCRGRIERVQQWQQKTDKRNWNISPITDSDVAQITGIRGGSGTDAGMQDPEQGPSRSRGPPPPPPQGGTGGDPPPPPPPPPSPSIPPSRTSSERKRSRTRARTQAPYTERNRDSRSRLIDPPKFAGKSTEDFNTWWMCTETYIADQPHLFTRPGIKHQYCQGRLEGHARAWHMQWETEASAGKHERA